MYTGSYAAAYGRVSLRQAPRDTGYPSLEDDEEEAAPISIHNAESFEAWLRTIPEATLRSGNVAVILDGSIIMKKARSVLRNLHKDPYADRNRSWLRSHSHLHDRVDHLSRGGPVCLLATETFYKRELGIEFVAVYDDCQVHRTAVISPLPFGIMECLHTFLVKEQELENRIQQAARIQCQFFPRAFSVDKCLDTEPVDLKKTNATSTQKVMHPMLGFPMVTPKITRNEHGIKYEPARNRNDNLSINHLPLANLLFDAARGTFSPEENHALLALICASQVTANLPHIFASPSRASFTNDNTREINVSVFLRAFVSGCGRSAEEIGLTMLYLQNECGRVKDINNWEGCSLLQCVGPDLLSECEVILTVVLDVMKDLIETMLHDLIHWHASSIASVRERLTATHAHSTALRKKAGSSAPRIPYIFLQNAFLSAAKRSQVNCSGFIVDVKLIPQDPSGFALSSAEQFLGPGAPPPSSARARCEDDLTHCNLEVRSQSYFPKHDNGPSIKLSGPQAVRDAFLRTTMQLRMQHGEKDDMDKIEYDLTVDKQGDFMEIRTSSKPLWLYRVSKDAFGSEANIARLEEEGKLKAALEEALEMKAKLGPPVIANKMVATFNSTGSPPATVARVRHAGSRLRATPCVLSEEEIAHAETQKRLGDLIVTIQQDLHKLENTSFPVGSLAYLRRRAIVDGGKTVVIVDTSLFMPKPATEVADENTAYDLQVTLPVGHSGGPTHRTSCVQGKGVSEQKQAQGGRKKGNAAENKGGKGRHGAKGEHGRKKGGGGRKSRTGICFDFEDGRCVRGNSCRFSHDLLSER